ncbi:hypothetical protein [Mesorhizobium sp. M0130]
MLTAAFHVPVENQIYLRQNGVYVSAAGAWAPHHSSRNNKRASSTTGEL